LPVEPSDAKLRNVIRPEALKGHLDGLILAILSSGPVHGYGLIEELRRRSGGSLDLPEGTVYPALHRLEAQGVLRSSWSSEAGRRRRVYRLTRRGHGALAERRLEWQTLARAVEAVLA
jgi:PadR family transcriptional regulator, regulatory protein PadR